MAGHTVVIPYLLTDATQVERFVTIADEIKCPVYEVYLYASKDTAIKRLLKRGKWGEAGSPNLTESDMPEIENLFDVMNIEMMKKIILNPLKLLRKMLRVRIGSWWRL